MLMGIRPKTRLVNPERLECRRLLATISGFAFIDSNNDAQRTSEEFGLPGVRIELRGELGQELESVTTSDLGFYAFTNLPAGTYSVVSNQPAAVSDGLETSSFPGVVVGDDEFNNIVVAEQDLATGLDFGEGPIRPAYVASLWVLASNGTDDYGALLRDVVSGAELASGNVALATRIRAEAETGALANPVSTLDRYATIAGEQLLVPATQGVLNNDFSPSTTELSANLLSPPEQGSLVFNADGSFSYIANADFDGTDSFEYEVIADGATSSATVLIDVAPAPNRPPVSEADEFQLNEDETLEVQAPGVLANDTDVDGDTLSAALTQQPSNGTLSFSGDGSFEYTPNQNFFGTDSFAYVSRDDQAESAETFVQLVIAPVNDAPEGTADSYVTVEDETLVITAAESVLVNDSDVDGDGLVAILATDVANGVLTLEANGTFAYEPNSGFSGIDSFTYIASDGTDLSAPITVILDIGSVNDAPIANSDEFSVSEDTTLSPNISVLSNDEDSDSDLITAELREEPSSGTVTLNSDGTFEYIPDSNFFGEDSFTYVANDGLRLSSPATVIITVTPINDAPLATGDQYDVNQGESLVVDVVSGLLSNDTDIENDLLTAQLAVGPSNGQVVLESNGAFEYVPALGFFGTDTFTYRVNDGTDDSNTATVTILVAMVNSVPQAFDDSYEVDENTTLDINSANGVLANDVDDDANQLLVAELVSQPENGNVVLNSDGSFSFTPSAGFSGTDSFQYQASDGIGSSNLATVTITVNPAPVTVSETVTVEASRDTSLFENSDGALGNGAGEYLFAGRTQQGQDSLRRALIAFDFSSIPANATITNASLTLNMSRTIVGAFDVALHRVTQDWGEGASDAPGEEGRGTDSAPGDATWIHSMFDSVAWSTPGGDFDSVASASTSVNGVGQYTWSSPQMAADIQAWLESPTTNAGWLLLNDESEVSAKRFDSRENATEANRPQLVVEYEVTSVAQEALAAGIESDPPSSGASEPNHDVRDAAFGENEFRMVGDSNLDGEVNFQDFLVLANNFGRTDAAFADGDFDENGTVDFVDFLALSQNFGRRYS